MRSEIDRILEEELDKAYAKPGLAAQLTHGLPLGRFYALDITVMREPSSLKLADGRVAVVEGYVVCEVTGPEAKAHAQVIATALNEYERPLRRRCAS